MIRCLGILTCLWSLCGLAGCGGGGPEVETIPVQGTVTLDGQPLDGAIVQFLPQGVDGASPAYGETGPDGKYTLIFSQDQQGAMPGTYKVTISTYREAEEDEDGNFSEAVPEKVPAIYNIQSDLTATVDESGDPIDFRLELEGPVVQPEEFARYNDE